MSWTHLRKRDLLLAILQDNAGTFILMGAMVLVAYLTVGR